MSGGMLDDLTNPPFRDDVARFFDRDYFNLLIF